MAKIDDLINKIEDEELQNRIREEVKKLKKQKKFGLVYEEHLPEATPLYDVPIKQGSTVVRRDGDINEVFYVSNIEGNTLRCIRMDKSKNEECFDREKMVTVSQFGQPIFPFVKPLDRICNAPDSDLWHILIESDNYHALQLLVYLYGGKIDCIYIDPPYNTGAKDWKYNNNYVDGSDSYRHSKWLSFMEHRLKLAKKLLNPKDSVLIVTIDEKEYLHLGCLLEQMFPEARIQMVSSVINPTGTQRPDAFNRTDEYLYFVRFGAMTISPVIENQGKREVDWRTFRRQGSDNLRHTRPNQFYPIYVNDETKEIEKIGEPITSDVNRFSVESISGCTTVFPIKDDGTEMMWSTEPEETRKRLKNGYIRVGKYQPNKPQQYIIQYLYSGKIADIENGKAIVTGKNPDGSIRAFYLDGKETMPTTQWNYSTHNAQTQGSALLKKTIGENRFSFPKSLYAVHDAIKLFVANKPNALIVDFFAGSGTTLHSINLLNAEDNGYRRCIMVTNNEVSEEEEIKLKEKGCYPSHKEWEKLGIAQYVTWPRTKCSILGKDVNGIPISGDYFTSLSIDKVCERSFTQISFFKGDASVKQKKELITLINKHKKVKLPTITDDIPFLISEDENFNASILFDLSSKDEWIDSLEGNEHITFFYILTDDNAIYKKIKDEVSSVMGKTKERTNMLIPMSDGFKSNAIFFKLGFLDKNEVALGRNLKELLPLLWMQANAIGDCPTLNSGDNIPEMLILPKNKMAVLIDEDFYPEFRDKVNLNKDIETVFIATDSEDGYREMISRLEVKHTYQLFRDYLDNFTLNKG